jgi:uncharacterized protein (DUF1501 family)
VNRGFERQIFNVVIRGWDSHNNQFEAVPAMQRQLAGALYDFHRTMQSIGLDQQVTAFTISDFGRTLQANATGTDHGWGAHQYVVGGAVRGGRVIGQVPPYDLGHDQEWRRGSMIPTIAIDQYGAALGRWFGVDEAGINAVFPKLNRFDPFAVDLF